MGEFDENYGGASYLNQTPPSMPANPQQPANYAGAQYNILGGSGPTPPVIPVNALLYAGQPLLYGGQNLLY